MHDHLKKDIQTSTFEGERTTKLPEGVYVQKIPTHIDARGSLFEVYNQRWEQYGGPVVHTTVVSIRPGWAKGWAIHADHEDRYMILLGDVELVLYDVREGSSTKGLLSVITLSDKDRKLVNIPIGIWHATENIGQTEAFLINSPTATYNYEDPDKHRLPLDTDQIPYKFHYERGW